MHRRLDKSTLCRDVACYVSTNACSKAILLLALLLAAGPVWAQEISTPERLTLPRLSQPIELDGLSTEPAWDTVAPLPVTMYQPTYRGTPTERTEIRIAYDGEYLYASGRFYDAEPDGIRSNSLYRDRYSGDDTFALVLDTFNDNENALWFYTSPAGVRFDQAVANDAEFSGGRPINESWNTHWDVATVQTDEGWFAEMRIPYSSLGFQDNNGRVVMGMIAYRFIARKNERHVFPAIAPNWNMGFAKPSVAQDVVLEGVASQKPLYITPYTLGGFSQNAVLNDPETAYDRHESFTRDLGLDLKYNLTNNLTFDATVNTDFAQVEADDQQVNLTRFSLFFPEKRQFFQERAGIFAFNFGFQDRLFHSRRISLNDDGEAVRIFTGGPVPDGADTIVIQEDVNADGDDIVVREGAPAGRYIRKQGLDFSAGEVGLEAGRRLSPPENPETTWRPGSTPRNARPVTNAS